MVTYSCIKSSASAVIKDENVRQSVEDFVDINSKLTHRGSFVVLYHAVYYYNHNIDLPKLKNGTNATTSLNHMFDPYVTKINGVWNKASAHPDVLDVIQDELNWPQPDKIEGVSRVIEHAAKGYAANLQAHVTNNSDIFINRTIKTFCLLNGQEYKTRNGGLTVLAKDIESKIKDPLHQYTQTPIHINIMDQFVRYHRDYLDTKGINLDGNDDLEKMLLYFVHCLRYQDDASDALAMLTPPRQPHSFYPVPIHQIGRQSITIDKKVLYYILKHANIEMITSKGQPIGGCSKFTNTMTEYYETYYKRYFDVERHQNDRRAFYYSDGITTNNVKISLKYVIDKDISRGPPQRRKNEERYESK
jgi:hypothetical protein